MTDFNMEEAMQGLCPHCGSARTQTYAPIFGGEVMDMGIHCPDCGSEWTETWQLTAVSDGLVGFATRDQAKIIPAVKGEE